MESVRMGAFFLPLPILGLQSGLMIVNPDCRFRAAFPVKF